MSDERERTVFPQLFGDETFDRRGVNDKEIRYSPYTENEHCCTAASAENNRDRALGKGATT